MPLPDSSSLKAGTSRTSGISSDTIATTANFLGSEIDNATNLDEVADVEVVWSYASAPTANKSVKGYILYSQDGTNYEEGAGDGTGTGDVDPLPKCLRFAFSPPADTATHRLTFELNLRPFAFKLLLMNADTGQTMTVTVNISTRKKTAIID